jgi:hypothetical protein
VTVCFNFWAAIIFIAIFFLRYGLLVREEEKKLLRVFGQQYREYMSQVPRFVPSLRAMRVLGVAGFLPLKREWIWHEVGSINGVLAATLLIKIWQDWRLEGARQLVIELALLALVFVLFALFTRSLYKRTTHEKV